jgi:hypothetical protein
MWCRLLSQCFKWGSIMKNTTSHFCNSAIMYASNKTPQVWFYTGSLIWRPPPTRTSFLGCRYHQKHFYFHKGMDNETTTSTPFYQVTFYFLWDWISHIGWYTYLYCVTYPSFKNYQTLTNLLYVPCGFFLTEYLY